MRVIRRPVREKWFLFRREYKVVDIVEVKAESEEKARQEVEAGKGIIVKSKVSDLKVEKMMTGEKREKKE